MSNKKQNIVWHHATVSRDRREKLNGHKGIVLWFTGLSGSGKSTLAHAVEEQLYQKNCHTYVLDGDNIRHGLCSDLTFSDIDRQENIRRIGELSKLMLETGIIVLAAFISPFKEDRSRVRSLLPHGDFIEIYCDCSLEVCEQRDPKGIYKKAKLGKIKNFTGISSPYEAPLNPELSISTDKLPLSESVDKVISELKLRGLIN